MFRSAVEKFRHLFPGRIQKTAPVQLPLVDAAELRDLASYAHALPWSLLEFPQHATHPLIGETLSFQRGRGYEFEENRAYQSGDETRLLNWRLYARTGDLYTKIFTEERRPQVFLLVDRRAAMRFATHGMLKTALAARIAACYAYQAQRQVLPVGGLLLNQAADWFSPAMGEAPLHNLIQSVVAATPPLAFDCEQPDLEESLQLMLHRLPAGCFVLLISDFSDLDPASAMPLLHHLGERHTIQAIQILDPVEQRLPVTGDFLIEDRASAQPLQINGSDELQQGLYTESFHAEQDKLVACFNACGIPFRTCNTRNDVETCLGQTHAA